MLAGDAAVDEPEGLVLVDGCLGWRPDQGDRRRTGRDGSSRRVAFDEVADDALEELSGADDDKSPRPAVLRRGIEPNGLQNRGDVFIVHGTILIESADAVLLRDGFTYVHAVPFDPAARPRHGIRHPRFSQLAPVPRMGSPPNESVLRKSGPIVEHGRRWDGGSL